MASNDDVLAGPDSDPAVQGLLAALKARLPALKELLARADGPSGGEDGVYRLYHQSWKVFRLAELTEEIVGALQEAAPGRELNPWFKEIVRAGTGRGFQKSDNDRWLEATRPVVEAYFHARYFLSMAVTYAEELEEAPMLMRSGWAAVLYLYGLR